VAEDQACVYRSPRSAPSFAAVDAGLLFLVRPAAATGSSSRSARGRDDSDAVLGARPLVVRGTFNTGLAAEEAGDMRHIFAGVGLTGDLWRV
jgi:hypothetical protein